MFENIAGYDDVKKELINLQKWIMDEENRSNPNIVMPKAILFYGNPGNGKSLFVKEYASSFNVPCFDVVGNSENISDEIHNIFEESKHHEFSIITIDEIDLLIAKSQNVERTLKAELDGLNSSNRVLVLATTNHKEELDEALLRRGRFDRIMYITGPSRKSLKEIFSFYIKRHGIKGNIDLDYISRIMCGISCSDVCAIINDALLRCGNNVTTEEIEYSFNRVIEGEYTPLIMKDLSDVNRDTVIHEIGHSLILYKYKDIYTFYRANINEDECSGKAKALLTNENEDDIKAHLADIEIALGGYAATEIVFKHKCGGCIKDLQDARSSARTLVNKLGYIKPEYALFWYNRESRMETEKANRRNEKYIEALVRKANRNAHRYLRKHKKEILALESIFLEKGYINNKDLNLVMEGR